MTRISSRERDRLLLRTAARLEGAEAIVLVLAARWWGRAILRWAVARVGKEAA